jgi:hypothetical protein
VIHGHRLDDVVGRALAAIQELPGSADHCRVHARALELVRDTAARASVFAPADLPLAIADLLGRPRPEGDAAAAACLLLWTGADLLDDLADSQVGPAWDGTSPHRLTLVAVNLLATLPHLAINRFVQGSGCGHLAGRVSHAVSEALWRMSEGQLLDLAVPASLACRDDYFRLIDRKTGAEMGLFAALPAMLADLPPSAEAAWRGFGERFGVMLQTFSDVVGTFARSDGNDLLRGKRSVAVLYACETLTGAAKVEFERRLVQAAQGDREAVARAVETMIGLGAARVGLLHVELLRHRAAGSLPICLAEYPVDHPIRAVLRAGSVI